MTVVEHRSDLILTTDTPLVPLMGELWGVCCRDIGENWPRYNGTALYMGRDVYGIWLRELGLNYAYRCLNT